jgi:hypothetical protein
MASMRYANSTHNLIDTSRLDKERAAIDIMDSIIHSLSSTYMAGMGRMAWSQPIFK